MDPTLLMPPRAPEPLPPTSLGISGGRSKRRSAKKAHWEVLGDVDDYVKLSERLTVPPPPPEPDTVSNTSREGFPDDVWEAACVAPDGGAALIRAFREVLSTRHQYKSQLSNIHNARAAKLETLSSPNRRAGGVRASTGLVGAGGSLQPLARGTLPSLASATLGTHINEAMKDGASSRALLAHDAMEREWDVNAGALSAATGRPNYDLVMQRGPEHRAKVEALDALEQATPITDRIGGVEAWSMSLRDAWERIVPVGNMFSGLSATIRERPDEKALNLQRVGRPLAPDTTLMPIPQSTVFTSSLGLPSKGTGPPGGLTTHDGSSKSVAGLGGKAARSLTLRGRDWQNSEWLQRQTATYARNLRKLYPHDPDTGRLMLTGAALETQLEDLAYAPITLDEVECQLRRAEPDAFAAYAEVKARLAAEAQAALAAAEAEAEAAAAAEAAAGPQPGAHVRLSSERVTLACGPPGDVACRGLPRDTPSPASASASVSLVHFGTAAVHYRWEALPQPPLPFVPSPSSAAPAPPPPRASGLSLSRLCGVLLPGEQQELSLVLRPTAPGLSIQRWALHTSPPLANAPAGGHLVLTATGLCTPSDESGMERAALDAELCHAEKMRKVHATVDRLLADVTPPPPPRRLPDVPEHDAQRCAAFDASNASAQPTLFFSPDVYAKLDGIYTDARAQLLAALAPPEEPAGKAKGKKGKEEAPPPPPPYPEAWDSCVATVFALLDALWAVGATPPGATDADGAASPPPPLPGPCADAADALREELRACEQSLRAPPDARVLLRHAMRAMVVGVAEAVADKVAAVDADYAAKLAEQEAEMAEAAEAAGDGEPPALPPGAVDERWRADKARAEAKKLLKKTVALGLWDALARDREAAGDALLVRLGALDAQAEEAEARTAAAAQPGEGGAPAVELEWARFGVLRHWARLGIPARPPRVLTGDAPAAPPPKAPAEGKAKAKSAGDAKKGKAPAKKKTPAKK